MGKSRKKPFDCRQYAASNQSISDTKSAPKRIKLRDICTVTFVGKVIDMRESSLAAFDMGKRRSGRPGDYEQQVSSLIHQLEALLLDRPRVVPVSFGPPASQALSAVHRSDEDPPDEQRDPKSFPQGRAAQARALIRQRRLRSDFLPASLFGEAAWDMLLDLYAAHYEGQPVSVSSLCIASAVPSTTALRAIEAMERDGSLARVPDLKDKRRIFLKISDARRAELDAYFDRLGA